MKYLGRGFISLLCTVLSLLKCTVLAQDSFCDKYTKALFGDNTGSNQYSFMIRLINTAFIGNYSGPSSVKITGILSPGTFNGDEVSLLPYFNGGLASANRGYRPGNRTIINFLDDGGVFALGQGKPSYSQRSKQYKLFSHMYQYFGGMLGCSLYGQDGFPAYQGSARMYEVHKFMNLAPPQLGYFIQELSLAAISLGVAEGDIIAVASMLNSTFGQACAPPTIVLPDGILDLQAMCINTACPLARDPRCGGYNHQGGFGINPTPADTTAGPQDTDLAPVLFSIANGGRGKYRTMTTSDIDITTTISGKKTLIPTFIVIALPDAPISFTASDILVTTIIDDTETVVPSQTLVPIGGGFTITGIKEATTDGWIFSQEFTSVIPSSVIEEATTILTADSSVITSTYSITVVNTALSGYKEGLSLVTLTSVYTSGGGVFTTVVTTEMREVTSTSTQSLNAAAAQTAAPLAMALIGAGVLGQIVYI
ncbi:hypothetical protein AOL_s00076g469 [Orbilia oligospora ATCC 24927]|uniref:Uncharacterized protein n=1 Tax=Arthrobotrys oligospora (strain ATCC 24927 / CBS 115.81 / DSM 1491) TaxID=756982 RepID=G1X9Y0_ARTOA|nr:hypothetical protein AOL_s00076g469 [Orbilia oligospora ATCC 24927]EGX50118.1 hypothetical protein AOL_s00076g469 [Orbilia oligospora ATCC 24927]